MPEPQYPTKEGLWSRGQRKEDSYAGVKLGSPYPKAEENFRKAIEGREDFDPAVIFVWGTMQATGLLNILKAVEESFGPEGQEVVRKAINRTGYETMESFLDNSVFPEGLDDIELISYIVTGGNTVLYASLERPWIVSEDRCDFDILWCPHQDAYSAFDCRIQRYFVEGMIQALEDRGRPRITFQVDKLIPRGGECCHFKVERLPKDDRPNPWHSYSDELGQRAFQKMKDKDQE